MRILVTGGTGKVGQHLLPALLDSPRHRDAEVVVLCHNRVVEASARVRVVRGSIADAGAVAEAMDDVTHVVHLAAVKESPDLAVDVSIKGMFALLERFRTSADARRFVLLGGDCVVGHIFHNYDAPIAEDAPRRAYPGVYALTKVIEEVMLEQYVIQYGIDGCILRAPWIMEKDDLRFVLSFGDDQFGGPTWSTLMAPDDLSAARAGGQVPVMLDAAGVPLRRNFIHVDDVVAALLLALDHPAAAGETFNIAMAEPVDYARLAAILTRREGLRPIEIPTPFHGNTMDCAKARRVLGWTPEIDLEALVDRAWRYTRSEGDERRIWYPG